MWFQLSSGFLSCSLAKFNLGVLCRRAAWLRWGPAWRNSGQEHHREVPTGKRGGGSVMMWGCMSVGEITFNDGTMNVCGYPKILAEKMFPSLQKLGIRGIFQHENAFG